MADRVRVLLIGLDPTLIDFSDPDYGGFPGLTAEKVLAGIKADSDRLNGLGYDVQPCMTDFGETAETLVANSLDGAEFDCVMIGAGVRMVAKNTPLFEKIINIVHERAPRAKLCFNTRPDDTADAIKRWAPPS